MLQKIDCPSYVQDQIASGDIFVDVAIMPWDEFHYLMCLISENNRKLIEANTLLSDLAAAEGAAKEFATPEIVKLMKRARMFIEK
jgi:hypothetical protein